MAAKQVFIVPIRVARTENSIMPSGMSAAYVKCYAMAANFETAIQRCVVALKADGMIAEQILQPIQTIDITDWAQHVVDQWPEYASSLPSQEEFEKDISNDAVVYGPFGAY